MKILRRKKQLLRIYVFFSSTPTHVSHYFWPFQNVNKHRAHYAFGDSTTLLIGDLIGGYEYQVDVNPHSLG